MSEILLIAGAIAAGSVSVILLLIWVLRLSERRGGLGQSGDGGGIGPWTDGGGDCGGGGGGDCGGGGGD